MSKLPAHSVLKFVFLENGILSSSGHPEFKPQLEGCLTGWAEKRRVIRGRIQVFMWLQVALNLSFHVLQRLAHIRAHVTVFCSSLGSGTLVVGFWGRNQGAFLSLPSLSASHLSILLQSGQILSVHPLVFICFEKQIFHRFFFSWKKAFCISLLDWPPTVCHTYMCLCWEENITGQPGSVNEMVSMTVLEEGWALY